MKIAHFVFYGPKRSGMYETARELCLGEVALDHEAKLIDTSWIGKRAAPTAYKFDRGVDIAPPGWAEDADVHVLHSRLPDNLYGTKPIVMLLHGAPEYTFYSEVWLHKEGDRGHSTLLAYAKEGKINKFVTLWTRHVPYWQLLFGDDAVAYVPPIVDMNEYKPEGETLKLHNEGGFNIGYCDTWRPTFQKEPFQILPGVREFWKKNRDAKFHIFGIPSEQKRAEKYGNIWDRHILAMKRQGDFIGALWEMTPEMPKAYRALDVVITNCIDESRVVRETLATGKPLVAPVGNKYTPYRCVLDDPISIADALKKVRDDLTESPEKVQQDSLSRIKSMGVEDSASKFIGVLEGV